MKVDSSKAILNIFARILNVEQTVSQKTGAINKRLKIETRYHTTSGHTNVEERTIDFPYEDRDAIVDLCLKNVGQDCIIPTVTTARKTDAGYVVLRIEVQTGIRAVKTADKA
jgi:hypothetical protein